MSYVRKGTGPIATRPSSGLSSDRLQVRIQGPGFPSLDIWNVYNGPAGAIDPGAALERFVQQAIPSSALVAGPSTYDTPAWDVSAAQLASERLQDSSDSRDLTS